MEAVVNAFRDFQATVVAKYTEFVDPTAATADEASRNIALRAELHRAQAQLADAQQRRQVDVAAAQARVAERKSEFERTAEPKLDRLDNIDAAKFVYDQIETHIIESSMKIQSLHQKELKSYGYQSKMAASFGLTLDATRAKLASGEPFTKELTAIQEELEDNKEMRIVTAPLNNFAAEGIATMPALLTEAKRLLVAVDEDLMTAHVNSAASVAPRGFVGWLGDLKVDVPNASTGSTPVAKESGTELRRALNTVVKDLSQQRTDAALSTLAAATRLCSGPICDDAGRLKRLLEGRMIADTALRFSDSMLTLMRFRLVEGVLSPHAPRQHADDE
jgi:hypothetical protein